LSGKKKALLQADVPARTIPNWPQLTVKRYYQEALALPMVADYLPDPTGKDEQRLPERDFFFKVLNSLHPDYIKTIVKLASNERSTKSQNL
jgi:hypothetical protein